MFYGMRNTVAMIAFLVTLVVAMFSTNILLSFIGYSMSLSIPMFGFKKTKKELN